jgi:hypothetical protein
MNRQIAFFFFFFIDCNGWWLFFRAKKPRYIEHRQSIKNKSSIAFTVIKLFFI